MKPNEIIKAMAARPRNQVTYVTVERPAKVRKAASKLPYAEGGGSDILKRSRIAVQPCDYARRSPVRSAVEAGEREAPELPRHIKRAEMVDGVKVWVGHNGQKYLPLPLFGEGGQAKTEWIVRGADGSETPVALESIAHLLLAEETREKPSKAESEAKGQAQINGPKFENIKSIA